MTAVRPATTLYLIRHAQADARGPRYPDDSLRPLVAKGHRQATRLAEGLERLEIRFDRLFSSPYTRAAQTAEPLAARLRAGREVAFLDGLADDGYAALLREIARRSDPDDRRIALVGHEPYLSELASVLLVGDPTGAAIRFRKAATMTLSGTPAPAGMTLEEFWRVGAIKRLRGR